MDTPDEQKLQTSIEGAGSVIRELRESVGKSVAEFSASLGVPESTFQGIEDNEAPLSFAFMLEIAKAAKIQPQELTFSCLKAAHPHLEDSKLGELLHKIVEAMRVIPDAAAGLRRTIDGDDGQVVGVSTDSAIQPFSQENQEHTGSEGVAGDTN